MNFWKEIEENLWDEGFDVLNENGLIEWESEKGNHSIEYKNISIDKNKLAWYQGEEYGRSWVKIKHSNGLILNWKLKSNHSDYGFDFRFIKWIGDKLIVIYTEKHNDYVFSIENLIVTELYSGNISEIKLTDNVIYIKKENETVELINLETDQITFSNMTINDFNILHQNVELKPFWNLALDKEYNKNYS
ncbi:hypothetical protein WFZ85_15980 [Flavobacterium sp. j3]|uniref:Uncharacterized protein n=1 Tax=Flavobacterium aureirubrum TaxID=3133147 RepID=A0ABU9N8S5_9FLAO